ncbi:hypothetical protein OU660_27260, partial [Escherichia coli]|nr:hypothetical protein [Escherichia coli]
SLKTSIKTITYLSDIGCLEIQGASLPSLLPLSLLSWRLTMFTMFFLVKLTIAIVIVCGILSPILVSPHNKLSTLFWKIPNAFWIFLICIYFAIAMAVLIESSEQTRIRRQQYFQQYEVPNETHKNVVIENSIKSQLI